MALVAGGGQRRARASSPPRPASVDLIIPRGGEGLKAALKGVATVPVIYAASGNCHVYVDATADPGRRAGDHAQRQDPAAQRLQRGRDAARARGRRREFLPGVLEALREAGVELHGDDARARLARRSVEVAAATEEDWDTEYLALDDGGRRWSTRPRRRSSTSTATASGHSEAIVTRDTEQPGRSSSASTPRACTSTRPPGSPTAGEFGMGAEIGNSTQKLHARGPIGLRELCTFKYLIEGTGHVRRLTGPGIWSARADRHPRRDVQPATSRSPRSAPRRRTFSSDSTA